MKWSYIPDKASPSESYSFAANTNRSNEAAWSDNEYVNLKSVYPKKHLNDFALLRTDS